MVTDNHMAVTTFTELVQIVENYKIQNVKC